MWIMKNKSSKIADLEECLAGFMICGALNGMYISPEQEEWCTKMLLFKKRTPAMIWKELYGSDEAKQKA